MNQMCEYTTLRVGYKDIRKFHNCKASLIYTAFKFLQNFVIFTLAIAITSSDGGAFVSLKRWINISERPVGIFQLHNSRFQLHEFTISTS
jgi:hypothetical protein